MKLIVGLGNPGSQYSTTRHNAGFMVIDRLSDRHGKGTPPRARFKSVATEVSIGEVKCMLLKPTTFMNLSGQAVGEAIAFFKVSPAEDLLVIVDDLYLPTGAVRLRPGGGSGGHNGLEDLHRVLAGDAYPRLRVGVGMLPGGGKPPHIEQADYVLSRFSEEERALLDASLVKAAHGAELWATRGLAHAMNTINAPVGLGPTGDATKRPSTDGTQKG